MKNKLLIRTLTGAVLVAFVVAFFFLRIVDVSLFSILVGALIILGTYELSSKLFLFKYKDGVKEIKTDGVQVAQFALTMVSAFLVVPAFELVDPITLFSVILAEIVVTVLVALIGKKGLSGVLKGALSAVYPKLLLSSILFSNALTENSLLALVMIFIISSVTDTFAYLVGSLLKGKKLCPKISPNKTISGAVGGLLGGVVASIALYFIIPPVTTINYALVLFIVLGVVCSVFTQAGDIVESYIKRRIGVKDMGNLLPGHGGVLDRVDGMMFASVIITAVIGLI